MFTCTELVQKKVTDRKRQKWKKNLSWKRTYFYTANRIKELERFFSSLMGKQFTSVLELLQVSKMYQRVKYQNSTGNQGTYEGVVVTDYNHEL